MPEIVTIDRFFELHFPEETLFRDQIKAVSNLVKFKKYDVIVKRGEVCNKTYLLQEGAVMQRYVEGLLEKATIFSFEGDVFTSWESYENQTPSEYAIQCLEDCTLSYIEKEAFDDITNQPEIGYRVLSEYDRKMFTTHYTLMSRLIAYSSERFYEYISTEYPHIIQRVPLKYIAEFMGISNEHLSRLRKKLMKK